MMSTFNARSKGAATPYSTARHIPLNSDFPT